MNLYWLGVCVAHGIVMSIYNIALNNSLYWVTFLLMFGAYTAAYLKKD